MEKKVKKFKNEDEERDYWAQIDSSDHFDFERSKKINFPKLGPSTKTISLRLPESMLEDIKIMANKRNMSYQSLIKVLLKEKIDDDQRRSPSRKRAVESFKTLSLGSKRNSKINN